jgi:hypothetical protein
LQYDPPTDAIAQLHDPPLYENAHIDIREQYYSVITQSTIVYGVSQRAPRYFAINATLYERFNFIRDIAPGFRIIRMLNLMVINRDGYVGLGVMTSRDTDRRHADISDWQRWAKQSGAAPSERAGASYDKEGRRGCGTSAASLLVDV